MQPFMHLLVTFLHNEHSIWITSRTVICFNSPSFDEFFALIWARSQWTSCWDRDKINRSEIDEVDHEWGRYYSKNSITHTVSLKALENLHDFFQFNSGSEGTLSCLDKIEKILFENWRKWKHTSIVNYFVKK